MIVDTIVYIGLLFDNIRTYIFICVFFNRQICES